jgi:hypothetical protein
MKKFSDFSILALLNGVDKKQVFSAGYIVSSRLVYELHHLILRTRFFS